MMIRCYSRSLAVAFLLFLLPSLYYYQRRLDFKNRYLDYRENKGELECTFRSSSRLLTSNTSLLQNKKLTNDSTRALQESKSRASNDDVVVGRKSIKNSEENHNAGKLTKLDNSPKTQQTVVSNNDNIVDQNKVEHTHVGDSKGDYIGLNDPDVVSHNGSKLFNTEVSPEAKTDANDDANRIREHIKTNDDSPAVQGIRNLKTNNNVTNHKVNVTSKVKNLNKNGKQNSSRYSNITNQHTGNTAVTRNTTVGKGTADQCKPSTRIVFLKTHKTGSSTMTSIFQRFGFSRNLTFVIPRHGHVISTGLFKRSHSNPQKNDMLVNHVRYNRKEMDAVMKADTKYVTILRDPATQAESVFGYFQMFRHLNLSKDANPFEEFISRPQYYMDTHQKFPMRNHLKNPLLYDLGLEPSEQLDFVKVQSYIENLSREFDLVLLQEYFNESLLLLKKLFCWDMNDILYIIKGVRINDLRFTLSDSLKNKSREWNSADVKFYDFFNATFWKKVAEYGSDFEKDLKIFEEKLNETFYECTMLDEKPKVDHRAYTYMVNPVSGNTCKYMLLSDEQFTGKLRNSARLSTMLKWRKRYPLKNATRSKPKTSIPRRRKAAK